MRGISPIAKNHKRMIFSVVGFCIPKKGTSRTDRSHENQSSSMITSPETIWNIRIVLSFGLWATNLAILRRRGFIEGINNDFILRKNDKMQARVFICVHQKSSIILLHSF
jgi:hypothetical protein